MTKQSSILITKVHGLDHLHENQKAVIRFALMEAIQGANEEHNRRWRRWVNRLLNAEPGEMQQFMPIVERSGPFHRAHMALETRLFHSQEQFFNQKQFRNWIKTGAGHVSWKQGPRGNLIAEPLSTSFEECSDDEMREFHESAMAFLRTDHAMKFLWPHLKSKQRAEMLEEIINRDDRQDQQ